MNNRRSHKPSQKAGILILVMVSAPLIVGIAGMYMWFIPNPDLRLIAAVIGGSYVLLIISLNSVIGRVNYAERWRQAGGGAKLALGMLGGLLMIAFGSFLVAFRSAPAEFTKLFGHPTHHAFSVTEIFRHEWGGSVLCPYTLTIESQQGGSKTDFCIDAESANRLHVGDQVQLRGKETHLGFKFDSFGG
ncbi:hypothetical protein [Rhodanobacter terrae]|uniref:Uncharacterized protein n=1 Tax=Rhodanobacter terrae TaxID=418647 RepID=A0ABW0T1T8_9GAMM